MTAQDALWSAQEVRTQAEQCPGQVDIWEACQKALTRDCDACGAAAGTACDPFCIGLAQWQEA